MSVIGRIMNLECSLHHRYFSPTPEAWVGKTCQAVTGTRGNNTVKCERKLRRIKSARKRKQSPARSKR